MIGLGLFLGLLGLLGLWIFDRKDEESTYIQNETKGICTKSREETRMKPQKLQQQ